MNLPTNPDYETLKLILIIAGSLILLLLAVIGFFLRQQVVASQSLAKAVSELSLNVGVIQSLEDDRHPVTVRRLNEHASEIKDHGKRITRMETILKIDKK